MSNHRMSNSKAPPASTTPPVFGILIVIAYLVALLPPVYIWICEQRGILLGLPVPVWYMLGVCIFAVAICGALYMYEGSREELD